MSHFKKRGDIIAEQIKQWIVSRNMMAGQRLPTEAALTEIFDVGKSSVREALKSLEVQGLVRTSAGKTGGSFIVEVPEGRAISLLQNYFYFKRLTADQIYELRGTLEPKLAAHIAKNASERVIAELRQKVEACRTEARTPDELKTQMRTNIEFHDILAAHSSNPLLCLHCRFVNRLVSQIVKRRESPSQRAVLRANFVSHEAILEAIEARDPLRAERRMADHIAEIQTFYPRMHVDNAFISEPTAPVVVPALDWPDKRLSGAPSGAENGHTGKTGRAASAKGRPTTKRTARGRRVSG